MEATKLSAEKDRVRPAAVLRVLLLALRLWRVADFWCVVRFRSLRFQI